MDWDVCAECGMVGSSINYKFLKSLSAKEIENLGKNIDRVVMAYNLEIHRRNKKWMNGGA